MNRQTVTISFPLMQQIIISIVNNISSNNHRDIAIAMFVFLIKADITMPRRNHRDSSKFNRRSIYQNSILLKIWGVKYVIV